MIKNEYLDELKLSTEQYENLVRHRAHSLWIADNYVHGLDREHWGQAEKSVELDLKVMVALSRSCRKFVTNKLKKEAKLRKEIEESLIESDDNPFMKVRFDPAVESSSSFTSNNNYNISTVVFGYDPNNARRTNFSTDLPSQDEVGSLLAQQPTYGSLTFGRYGERPLQAYTTPITRMHAIDEQDSPRNAETLHNSNLNDRIDSDADIQTRQYDQLAEATRIEADIRFWEYVNQMSAVTGPAT